MRKHIYNNIIIHTFIWNSIIFPMAKNRETIRERPWESREERKPDGVLKVEGREREHQKENGMGDGEYRKLELEINGVRLWSTRKEKKKERT